MISIDALSNMQVGVEMRDLITKTAEKVLFVEESEDCEVSVFLTDDAEIRRLNKLYRDVDRSTDVLAFAMREGMDSNLNRYMLGDVVISLPMAEQQASLYGNSLELEISLLVSHGILHLLGYDHERRDELLLMRQKQIEILCLLGYDLSKFEDHMGDSASGVERQVIGA